MLTAIVLFDHVARSERDGATEARLLIGVLRFDVLRVMERDRGHGPALVRRCKVPKIRLLRQLL